jgi:hypothetical protein
MYKKSQYLESRYKSLRLKEFSLSKCNFDLPAGVIPNSPIVFPYTSSEKKDELPHPCKTIYKYDYTNQAISPLSPTHFITRLSSPNERESAEEQARVQTNLRSMNENTNSDQELHRGSLDAMSHNLPTFTFDKSTMRRSKAKMN